MSDQLATLLDVVLGYKVLRIPGSPGIIVRAYFLQQSLREYLVNIG